jgi:hypothetical protein
MSMWWQCDFHLNQRISTNYHVWWCLSKPKEHMSVRTLNPSLLRLPPKALFALTWTVLTLAIFLGRCGHCCSYWLFFWSLGWAHLTKSPVLLTLLFSLGKQFFSNWTQKFSEPWLPSQPQAYKCNAAWWWMNNPMTKWANELNTQFSKWSLTAQ